MTDIRKLARHADVKLLERDGLALAPSAQALALLEAVRASGARILAIDGFVVEDGEIFADAAAESDFTDVEDLDDLAEEAADFLSGFAPADDLYWDFILDED